MVTTRISDLHINAKNTLKRAGIENYRFEAAVLLEHFFGIRSYEIANLGGKSVSPQAVEELKGALEKRIQGYPLQYIVGEWEFFGLLFYVGEGVLIPRQDTETLVEAVLERVTKTARIADLCSGSGCIAVTLEKKLPASVVYAVERSEAALSFLSRNLQRNASGVKLIRGDVLSEAVLNNFTELDVIVCNPPYVTDAEMDTLQQEVRFEPAMALEGGPDGLYFYREITSRWKGKLVKGGLLAYEIGAGQEFDVADILTANGFSELEFVRDLTGTVRVVTGTKL